MKEVLEVLAIVCLIALLTATAVYLEDRAGERGRQALEAELAQAIAANRAGETTMVDLSSVGAWEWDTLHIFGPYTSRGEIDARLGRVWLGARLTKIETKEGIALLVWTSSGRVTQYLEFPRYLGDFARLASNPGIAEGVLSRSQMLNARRSISLARMEYGNALERLVAQDIRNSPLDRLLFQSVGGKSNPDFVGRGLLGGMNFDITTPGQIAAHLKRPGYGQGLNIIKYNRPGGFGLFP